MRTASVMNMIVPDAASVPEVGSGATLCFWTDRKACTVIEADEKHIKVQVDKSIRTDNNGMSELQDYAYEPDPEGTVYNFTRRRNGKFFEEGTKTGEGTKLSLGARRTYHDYSF